MRKGFSLVELSIVLVILGLLTGGILAGQSLIRAAELRSVTTDFNRYTTAVQSFRDKYFALPGDMINATAFWGAAHATPATCRTTASTTTATCNGNGDGFVFDNGSTSNESFRFWQQLANAGLIEGTYSGITQGASNAAATTANAPRGKISNTLWFVWYWGALSGAGDVFDYPGFSNNFEFGTAVTDVDPYAGALKPEEAWNIDTKLDDGKPGIGKIVVRCNGGLNNCTTATGSTAAQAAATNSDYLLTSTNKSAALWFRNIF